MYQGLGTHSLTPETISQFAPKRIDSELSRKIQSYLDIRPTGSGLINSNGSQVFFGWGITGVNQVFRLDQPMGFPIQMTGGEDPSTLMGILPDDKTLIISRDQNGEETPGLYLQAIEGGSLKCINHVPGKRTFLEEISDDSKFIYYSSNELRDNANEIYRYEIASGKREIFFSHPDSGLWSIADRKGENEFLMAKFLDGRSRAFSLLDTSKHTLCPLLGWDEREDFNMQFGANDNEFIVLTPKFGEFRRLYSWSNGNFTPIGSEMSWDVDSFQIDPLRKRILFTVNEGGYTKCFGMDAKTKTQVKLPTLPLADHTVFFSNSHNSRFTSFRVSSTKCPQETYFYEWESGALTKWTQASNPEVDLSQFADLKLEHYPARDGTKIPMFVRRPADYKTRCCPVIVEFHGGPESQSVAGFNASSQLLVDAGFIVAKPNVRGSDGYGKTWLQADDGAKRLDVISDIEDASIFIRKNWTYNGQVPKVGICGGSYGGYATLMGMTYFAGAYDVGVSIVGMSNLYTFLLNTAPYRRALRISKYGNPETEKEMLLKLSPITYIDRVKAPLLIMQGVNDPRVPAGEALQIYDALKNKKIECDLVLYADEGHGTQKRSNIVSQIGHMLAYFKKHLLLALLCFASLACTSQQQNSTTKNFTEKFTEKFTEQFPFRKFYGQNLKFEKTDFYSHPLNEDLLTVYQKEFEDQVPESKSENDATLKNMAKVFAKKNQKILNDAQNALTHETANFSQQDAEKLRSEMLSHKVVGAEEYDHYQSQEIGFCFGRATYVHLRLSQLNIPQNQIAKIFVFGNLRYQGQLWKYHMATMVMGQSNESGEPQKKVWWVIDSLFPKVMDLSTWKKEVEKLSILYPQPDTRFYVSDPRKFLASSGEYQNSNLEVAEYNGYFLRLQESLNQNTF